MPLIPPFLTVPDEAVNFLSHPVDYIQGNYNQKAANDSDYGLRDRPRTVGRIATGVAIFGIGYGLFHLANGAYVDANVRWGLLFGKLVRAPFSSQVRGALQVHLRETHIPFQRSMAWFGLYLFYFLSTRVIMECAGISRARGGDGSVLSCINPTHWRWNEINTSLIVADAAQAGYLAPLSQMTGPPVFKMVEKISKELGVAIDIRKTSPVRWFPWLKKIPVLGVFGKPGVLLRLVVLTVLGGITGGLVNVIRKVMIGYSDKEVLKTTFWRSFVTPLPGRIAYLYLNSKGKGHISGYAYDVIGLALVLYFEMPNMMRESGSQYYRFVAQRYFYSTDNGYRSERRREMKEIEVGLSRPVEDPELADLFRRERERISEIKREYFMSDLPSSRRNEES
ncbi:MAG: hypothetical protein HYT76_03320 [Deltaproteobacteria bacterium]|nr:hypothetical protein [Deltaproteobacteria bacterium]